MTTLIILIALATTLSVALWAYVRHDGRGPAQPPRSHCLDSRFLSPSAR